MTGWDKKEVECEMRNVECGMRNVECVMWNEAKTAVKYLPKGTVWYDFWTGKAYKGGQTVTLATALNRVPLGTILSCASIREPTAVSPSMRMRATTTTTSAVPMPPSPSSGMIVAAPLPSLPVRANILAC